VNHTHTDRTSRQLVLTVVLALGPMLPASAALVSGTLDFTATDYAAGAPYATVTGRVAYSFDNSAGFFNLADGQTANGVPVRVEILAVSLPGQWTPVLSYFTSFNGNPVDFFAIGHAPTTFVAPATDDWRVAFDGTHVAVPTFREATYAVSSVADRIFMTTIGSVVAVPEPATWALLGGGLGLLAWRARRRTK
jgi:hypothetical protein